MQSYRPGFARIELVDVARGAALIAMAVYHFTWDLDFFGYIDPGTSVTGGWKIFARSIAISFLFLVGVSLYLAHANGVRVKAFLKRLGVVALAAAAITLVTYVATPNAFIFFGILHHIAVASMLGVLVLGWPVLLLLVLAGAIIAAPHLIHSTFFDHPVFWWTGLSNTVPPTNDFFPILPWFGVVVLGIAAAKVAAGSGLLVRLAAIRPARRLSILTVTGRHSLLFYLAHQPILFSSVALFAHFMPPAGPDIGDISDACTAQCVSERDESFCRAYCNCVVEGAEAQNRLNVLYSVRRGEEEQRWLNDLALQCSVENND